jgi:hypothetical protein
MKTIRYRNAAARASADAGRPRTPPPTDPQGGWVPDVWLGSPAPGGLALPDAHPTARGLYAPRGVHLGSYRGTDVLIGVDTGNHRLLIWHGLPTADHQPCDVVVGQPDATSEGPAGGTGDTRAGLFLPTGAMLHDDMLIVADAWHHRVLVYRELPERPGAVPDLVIGQDGLAGVAPNRGRACAADTLYWPFGVAVVGGAFYIADTGNRRVLGWSAGVPVDANTLPDLILGQSDAHGREENRGADAGPDSFRWPHDIAGTADRLLVADAGNHRVLGWPGRPRHDRAAELVLGQPDFTTSTEWPYAPQRNTTMRFPYGVDVDGDALAVADTANNRVLLWDRLPEPAGDGTAAGADAVLGQPDFAAAGENRWTSVLHDTLCWPYGVTLRQDRLAVADSGNNRVLLWRRR